LETTPTPSSTLFPYTTLFRSLLKSASFQDRFELPQQGVVYQSIRCHCLAAGDLERAALKVGNPASSLFHQQHAGGSIPRIKIELDRKSTRLNSSHSQISYAVF